MYDNVEGNLRGLVHKRGNQTNKWEMFDTITEETKQYLEIYSVRLAEMLTKFLTSYPEHHDEPRQMFLRMYLERFLDTFETVPVLLSELSTKRTYHALVLVLRANMLDLMQLHYFFFEGTLSSGENELRDQQFSAFYSDHIRYTINQWTALKENGYWDESTLQQSVRTLESDFPELFATKVTNWQNPADHLKTWGKKISVSAEDMLRELTKVSDYNVFGEVYSLYAIYSKFEHPGLLHSKLSKVPFVLKVKDITLAVHIITLAVMSVIEDISPDYDISEFLDIKEKQERSLKMLKSALVCDKKFTN